MNIAVSLLLASIAIAPRLTAQQPQPSLTLFCSLEHPVIAPGGSVAASAITDPAQDPKVDFQWTASDGAFVTPNGETPSKASASQVVWSARDISPGAHKLTVNAHGSAGLTATCSLTVFVSHLERGAENISIQDLARAFLAADAAEAPDYGLYSYLILPNECASSHAGTVRQRCEILVRNALLLITDEKKMRDEDVAPIAHLDITYLLVTHQIPADITSDLDQHLDQQVTWILANYDYSRCHKLRLLVHEPASVAGPLIISMRYPVLRSQSSPPAVPRPQPLVQDFSDLPLNIVEALLKQFQNQVLQHPLSQPGALDSLFWNLRKFVAIAGLGIGPAQSAVKMLGVS